MLEMPDLIKLLKDSGKQFVVYKHKALFSVQDSEDDKGGIEGAHTKNLFLKNKKNNFYLFSCEENSIVNLKTNEFNILYLLIIIYIIFIIK